MVPRESLKKLSKLVKLWKLLPYHEDLRTPGSSPRLASSRKQIRQILNFRRYARGRPQRLQRLYPRTLNLGRRSACTRFDVFAIVFLAETPGF